MSNGKNNQKQDSDDDRDEPSTGGKPKNMYKKYFLKILKVLFK